MDADTILHFQPKTCPKFKEWAKIKEKPIQPYDDYKHCAELLKSGITAIKYNFCDARSRTISIKISNDEKTLYYKDD